ncbi:MAG: autoinducer binding domain-containing protein [Rhodomicrobium sp.]
MFSETDSISIYNKVSATDTAADCSKAYVEALAPHGIDTLAAGEIDLADEQLVVFFAIEWPESWRKFYLSSGLQERDPVVRSLARYGSVPFTWTDLRNDRSVPQLGARALDLSAQHGWTEGLVIPLPRGGTRYGLVSLVGRRGPFSAAEIPPLAMVSIWFHNRVRTLASTTGFPVPPLGLSEREIQCLRLVSRGLPDREVADKLGISHATAKDYFENARRKLKAATRAQAVATAVSFGVITCDAEQL